MRKLVCLSVMVALAASASASVDFFFTSSLEPYGFENSALARFHGAGNGTDFIDGYKLSPAGVPPLGPKADVILDCADPNHFAYIWARFNGEPDGRTIIGIKATLKNALGGTYANPGDVVAYHLDNTQDWEIERKRWDGDDDVFYYNPPGMVAVTANGIRNVPGNLPWNLYVGGDYRTFLLGAVFVGGTCPNGYTISFDFDPVYPVFYREYPGQPNPDVFALNEVIVVPEPASLMLLGLAVLALRRR